MHVIDFWSSLSAYFYEVSKPFSSYERDLTHPPLNKSVRTTVVPCENLKIPLGSIALLLSKSSKPLIIAWSGFSGVDGSL